MAGRGDEMAARAGEGGRLRASHADREQVIGTLKVAFVQGLLDKDEFDLRVGQAFASRTYADLAAVTADFPAGLAAAQPPRQPARAKARPPVNTDVKTVVPVITAMTVLTAGLWAAVLIGQVDGGVVGMLTFTSTLTLFGFLILAGVVMRESRYEKRPGGQLPPRPAQRGQALEDNQDSGTGDDLTLSEARSDVCARHLPGHGVIQRTWRSLTARRGQRRPAAPQVTA